MDARDGFLVRVAASTQTSKVAGAIAGVMRERSQVGVQAIGAAAVNQALKAIIVASGFLREDGIELVFFPELVDVEINGMVKSAMKFSVERRK